MSYLNDWYHNNLTANQITSAVIYNITTEEETDITDYISAENNILQQGSGEDLFNSFSSDSLNLELYNGSLRFEGFDFKNNILHLTVETTSLETDDTYTKVYTLTIANAVRNNDYITLECNNAIQYGGIDVVNSKKTWGELAPGESGSYQLYILWTRLMNAYSLSYDSVETMANHQVYFDCVGAMTDDYRKSAYQSIATNGEFICQMIQLLGRFAYYCNSSGAYFQDKMKVLDLPKTILNREVDAYVYGGTYDEVDVVETEITLQKTVASESIDVSDTSEFFVSGEVDADEFSALVLVPNVGSSISIRDNYEEGTPIDVSNYASVQIYYHSDTLDTCDLTYGLLPPYKTGDALDGNSDAKDGGSFTDDCHVLGDDQLVETKVNEDYYHPTGLKATVAKKEYGVAEYGEEEEMVVGSGSPLVDMNNNSFIKMMNKNGQTRRTILENIFYYLDFPSVKFEVTIPNNWEFKLGEAVAICTGVSPTRYSYIDSINTDLNGNTILSNNRGEQ